jgi:erythromycin esterase-like protein
MTSKGNLIQSIKNHSVRFDTYDDLGAIVEAAANKQYVLLGEASHGTSEFYTLRAEISKRLIEDHGFSFIAVEGDWPSCFTVNQYIKGFSKTDARMALQDFNRWPSWMWANEEILELVNWMKEYNESAEKQVGFYGIDVYSLWESMEEIIRQLERIAPEDVESAKQAFSCFEPFERRGENYAISSAYYGEDCTEEVIKVLIDLQKKRKTYPKEHEGDLNLEVNSLVMLDAERYYRAMAKGGADDWNIRDTHMVSALEKIMQAHGEGGKAIVWEHNTHIGDARATDMADDGMINVGQILREKYGQKVYAIGFGTHHGKVIASQQWGGAVEVMEVPDAGPGSWEDALHQAGDHNKYLIFNKQNELDFDFVIGHRAIGVVYDPEIEHLGNYVPSNIAKRYDAFLFIDETNSLRPLFK